MVLSSSCNDLGYHVAHTECERRKLAILKMGIFKESCHLSCCRNSKIPLYDVIGHRVLSS